MNTNSFGISLTDQLTLGGCLFQVTADTGSTVPLLETYVAEEYCLLILTANNQLRLAEQSVIACMHLKLVVCDGFCSVTWPLKCYYSAASLIIIVLLIVGVWVISVIYATLLRMRERLRRRRAMNHHYDLERCTYEKLSGFFIFAVSFSIFFVFLSCSDYFLPFSSKATKCLSHLFCIDSLPLPVQALSSLLICS